MLAEHFGKWLKYHHPPKLLLNLKYKLVLLQNENKYRPVYLIVRHNVLFDANMYLNVSFCNIKRFLTIRVSGFELDFNVETVLNSLILQIEIVNEVGMTNKS